MAQDHTDARDADSKKAAAHHHDGQDQEPRQAEEDSSSLWDSDQHSDAPGPFGTGGE